MGHDRLAERRRQLGLAQEDVAATVGCAVSTVQRWEYGAAPRPAQHRLLAEALQWSAAQLTHALTDGELPAINGHQVPGWLGVFASFEQAAGRLCAFEATTIHGLLQTADYAFAVERADAIPKSDEGIVRRVESRLARQAVLKRRPDPLELEVILDESTLRRVAGIPGVMGRQLEHLIDVAEWPNVEVRVLPLDAGVFAFGSFTLLTSPGATAPYLAVTENRVGPNYMEHDFEIEAHTVLWAHLLEIALTPAESIDLIRAVSKESS